MTSGTYNSGFDYMNISIKWDSDNGVISEHGCMSWLDVVMDGCNVPKEGGSNFKHGGTIDSNYPTVDATLRIEPLVMRQIWDRYDGDNQKCNPVDTNHYIDQGPCNLTSTLTARNLPKQNLRNLAICLSKYTTMERLAV